MRIPFRKYIPTSTTTSQPTLASDDIEKNGGSHTVPAAIVNAESIQLPPKLQKFQLLTGISSSSLLRSNPTLPRPAPNQGIYKRTVDEEAQVKLRYQVSNYVVNIGGMLLIVVGAALTALGAANGPSGAVTVLGALNTIVAGLLTYLKGQGLPMRLEQYLHLLRTLREHIEERERDFLEPDCPLDVDLEIQRIAKMYQEVRQTAEDNAPGTVLPPRGVITSLLKKPDINRSDVLAPTGDKTPTAILTSGLQDLASFGQQAEHMGKEKVETDMQRRKHDIMDTVKEGKGVVEHAKRDIGDEIKRLGDVAKETFERLHGHEGEVRRSMDKGPL